MHLTKNMIKLYYLDLISKTTTNSGVDFIDLDSDPTQYFPPCPQYFSMQYTVLLYC